MRRTSTSVTTVPSEDEANPSHNLDDGELLKLHVLMQLDGASEASKICFSSPISEPFQAYALHLHQMYSQKLVQFTVQASFGPFLYTDYDNG